MSGESSKARARSTSAAANPASGGAPQLGAVPADAVPPDVRAAARRAFAVRDRQAEVLDLVGDSLLDEPDRRQPRRLLFGRREDPLRVHVLCQQVDDARVRLCVAPDAPAAELLAVESDEGVPPVEPGPDQGWLVGPLEHGLFSAVIGLRDRRLRTSWTRV